MKLLNKKGNKKFVAIAIFFGLMFLFTLISRFIDSERIPRVSAEYPRAGRLSIQYSTKGTVTAAEQSYWLVQEGLYVSEVFTAEGDWVEEGDVLYTFLPEEVEKAFLKKQVEWHELKNVEAVKAHEQEAVNLKLQLVEKELEQLTNLRRSLGVVTAQTAGTVLSFPVAARERTKAGNYIAVGNHAFVKIEPEDWNDTWNPSDEARVTITVLTTDKRRIPVVGTLEPEENGSGYFVRLPEGKYLYGAEVTFEWKEQTKEYSTIVPLDALHQNGEGKYYVYRLRKSSGILGEKEYAESVTVEIEKRGSSDAAIIAALRSDDFIILPGDNVIRDGQRVHVSQQK